jgi:23S rRNA (uracil1939-C5)-methyltransferase
MELKIEKWIYGGEGLARMAPDETGRGKAVFVPFVLPDELTDVEITEEKSGFARARLHKIIKSSPVRVEPHCPYFQQCGGCQYQHADYAKQLEWKRDILLETLQRTAKIKPEREIQLHSGPSYEYRNRTRLKVRSAPEFAIGYYRFGTNDLLPVAECPISSPLIQRSIQAAWSVGKQEISTSGLREIQFFANHADNKLLVEFYTDRDIDADSLRPFADALRADVREIVGVSVFPWSTAEDDEDRSPSISIKSSAGATFGDSSLEYETAHGIFRVTAGSFFQTNRFLVDELVSTAVSNAKGRTAIDLYAGTGLFSGPLAKRFDRVIAVEASRFSYSDLQHNVPPNVKAVQATTQKYLENVGKKAGLDLALLDPPRSGMGEHTARLLVQTQVPRITYVSCDPATLARDLRVLTAAGYRLESAHLVDLFPQTFHMETVVHLVR